MLLQHIQQDHRLFNAITYLLADSFDIFDSHQGWRVPLVLHVKNGGLASEIEYIHKYSCDSRTGTTLRPTHALHTTSRTWIDGTRAPTSYTGGVEEPVAV
jgi:hypothetical protein